MKFVQFGRGEFLGVLLPGAFLLVNLIIAEFPNRFEIYFSANPNTDLNISETNSTDDTNAEQKSDTNKFGFWTIIGRTLKEYLYDEKTDAVTNNKEKSDPKKAVWDGSMFIVISFVGSYIIGYALRLIKPDYLEPMSLFLGLLIEPIRWFFQSIKYCILKWLFLLGVNKSSMHHKPLGRQKLRLKINNFRELGIRKPFFKLYRSKFFKLYAQSFPYMCDFLSVYIKKKAPNEYRRFYIEYITHQYLGGKRLNLNNPIVPVVRQLNNLSFFNNCKLYVLSKSDEYRDEVLFSEGMVRFCSGMSYALLISIPLLAAAYWEKPPDTVYSILAVYLVLFVLFIFRLKKMRKKEMLTVMDMFAYAHRS